MDQSRAYASVRRKDPAVLRWLRCATSACLGAGQRPSQALTVDVANPRTAQEQVQAELLGPLLYIDSRAAFGRTGHIGLVHKLGNKTFSYKLPIHPHRAQTLPHKLGLAGSEHDIAISRSKFRLCQKILASLLPQLNKLQRDVLAHHNYVESINADQLAMFMRPNDALLAATDQAVHGTRQGVISASLSDATVQLEELGSVSHRRHVITSIADALAVLSRPVFHNKWFHRNAVYPDKEQPLVTSMSADTMHLPAAAVLDIANTCSGPDGCSVGVLIRCIAKGGLLDVIKTACSPDQAGTGLQPRLRDAIVLMLSAAPQGSELVRDVLLAIQHGLEVACSTSFLPELLLRLLQLPDVSQAGRLLGLRRSLCRYLQHQQPRQTPEPALVTPKVAMPTPAPRQNWYSKKMLSRSWHKYLPDTAVNDAPVSTPAFQQALYIQQHAETRVSRTGSVELLARILSRQPNKPKAESTLLDEKIPQQQVQCAAIKALLQLSPLLAEEASPGQAASEVLINVLLPGDDVSAPGRTDQLNATEAELRQLCLLALSNLSAQPQSLTSLLSLSPPLGGAGSSAIAAGPSHLYSQLGHALWSRLDDLFLTGWQHKQGSLAPQSSEIYLQLKAEYLRMVPHPLLATLLARTSTKTWLVMQDVLFSLGPEVYWSQRRMLLVIRTMELQTAFLDSVCLTGAAGGAVQGCLNPRILEIYTAFAVQQLTAPTSQCNVAQVILDYFAAFARLVAALPSDQAPADLRLSRSPLWPCSQANLLPSSTDRVTPPPPDVVAVHALSPATDEDTARTGEVASQAVSVPQPSTGTTQPVPVTRAQALKVLDFLVVPPEGLVWTVLNDSSKPVEERQAALSLLTTIYQSNCCSILADADHAAYCSTFHFTAFTSAYAEKDVHLCCQHLKALHALAKHKGPAARQQLYDLRAMDFLIQQVSLEAELHMVVSLPVSSTPTTAPIETSGLHSAAAQPTSCPFRTPGLLQSSRQATAPGVPQATVGSLGPQPPKASYRSPSSRLRLPALAPGSARSPRISARYLGLQANGDAFKGAELPPLDRVTMPAGFVSTGDLEEDTQQLLEMDSESNESDSSSVQSSPPTSSRTTPKGPHMPLLNLAGPARKGGPAALATSLSSASRTGGSLATPASPITPHIPSLLSPHAESHQAASPFTGSPRKTLPRLVLPVLGGQASLRSNASAQVTTPSAGNSKGHAQGVASDHAEGSQHDLLPYEEWRQTKLIYSDSDLHLQVVQLILELLLTADGELDPHHSTALDSSAQQPLSILQKHLSYEANAGLSGALLQWAKASGVPAVRLLRLTCRFLFDRSMYQDMQRTARGAFAQVFTCHAPSFCMGATELAVKLTDLPTTAGDNSMSQVTAFREVAIMQRLSHIQGICRIHDFGICADSIMLVMTKYRCSLREWRHRQPDNCRHQLRLYLHVFAQVAKLLQVIADQGIVHFDLKCDNIFVQPLPGVSEENFWSPVDEQPPFEVVLGDFGDSHDFSQARCHNISLNRGTECMRSPEMLLSSSGPKAEQDGGQKHIASDVWALGCLLYELVTGTVLFPNELDWPKFFITVTDPTQALLSTAALEALQQVPAVTDLLTYILVRDLAQRPSAGDIYERVQHILQSLHTTLPAHHRPVVLPLSPLKSITASSAFLTPASPSSPAQQPSMAAFYSSHLAAVSERLCLGPVSVMQDAMLLRRANVTHAVIVCSHAQLRHAASPQELSVAEVLTWLLADAQLAQAVRSCAAAGVQAKLVSVKQPDKDGDTLAEETALEQQLPAMLHYVADVLHSRSSTVLIAGCNGLEGEAAVVAAAYGSYSAGQDVYHALVELQHCYHILQLEDRHKQQLARWFAAQLASGKLAAS